MAASRDCIVLVMQTGISLFRRRTKALSQSVEWIAGLTEPGLAG